MGWNVDTRPAAGVRSPPAELPPARAPAAAGMAASVLLADTVYDVGCNVILDSAMKVRAWCGGTVWRGCEQASGCAVGVAGRRAGARHGGGKFLRSGKSKWHGSPLALPQAIAPWDIVTSMIKCWVFGTIISTGGRAGGCRAQGAGHLAQRRARGALPRPAPAGAPLAGSRSSPSLPISSPPAPCPSLPLPSPQ